MKIFVDINEETQVSVIKQIDFCCGKLSGCLTVGMVEFFGTESEIGLVKKKTAFAFQYCPFCGKVVEYEEIDA